MATNRLLIKESDNGGVFPLRGDMDALVDFKPTINFSIKFVTYTDENFTLNFEQSKVRLNNGALENTMTFGGKISLFVEFMFNAKHETWDIVAHNLFAATGGGGGDGGGPVGGGEPDTTTGNRPEVLLLPDANGILTPDGSVSNRFRFEMTKNLTLANPVNFYNNEHIYLTGYQDETGGKKLSFGKQIMLPGAVPFVPPLGGSAGFLMELRPTQNIKNGLLNWAFWGYPDKGLTNGFGLVTEIAQINDERYFTMAQTFAEVQSGDTVKILRNGVSAEVTSTIRGVAGDVYTIVGMPIISATADKRPTLELLGTDFGAGGANRPAFGKALLNFEDAGTFYVRDLIIAGTRGEDGTGRGICPNTATEVHVNNVKLYNNNNGMMWGYMLTTTIYITDSEFDFNGIGTNGKEDGYTHNVYAGHSAGIVALRSSFTRSQKGHDFKSRAAYSEIKQCYMGGAYEGRELELPNGGRLLAEDCIFEKIGSGGQNDLCVFGQEGVETNRPREYIMRNCRFINNRAAGTSATFVNNMDTGVICRIIDPEFIGDSVLGRPDKGLINCVVEFTGGPLGPQLPVGYQPIPMTPPV